LQEPVEEGVQMRINEDGLPTGECFVGFANEEALKSALERNRKVMGHRFVQVERIFPGELEKACANMRLTDKMRTALGLARPVPTPVAPAAPMGLPPAPGPAATAAQAVASSVGPRSAPPAAGGQNARGRGVGVGDGGSSSGNVVIKMRGLPYSATEPEIAQFFSGLRIAPGGASIGRDANGRASGEAHVEFCSEADAQAAMLLHRQRIGNRYIELFRTKQLPSASRRAVSAEAGGAASDTLRLRGMPFHSTDADVNAFFKGYSIAQGGIKLGPQGGHGSVRFTTAEEARRALVNLNHSYMGNRYIELFVA
jgi:RNA recognition motif-containing protein